MKTTIGKWQVRNITRVFPAKLESVLEFVLLFAVGAFAITLHAKLRIPIKVPGHHGLELMALLIAARSLSKKPLATTISGLGIAAFCILPFLGFRDPFMPIVFFIPTIIIDGGLRLFPMFAKKVWFLTILAAVAHATIPITRTIISFATGFQYGSLQAGIAYPLFTYISFGVLGGLLGAGLVYSFRKK